LTGYHRSNIQRYQFSGNPRRKSCRIPRIPWRLRGSRAAVEGTRGNATTRPAAAAGPEDQTAAEQVPATSPLIDEVAEDHPVRAAIEDAEAERRAGGLGKPGNPLNARSPFMIGMKAAAGVAVTYGLVELFLRATKGTALVGGVIGAGQIVISTLSSIVLVGVMTIYFLAGMPQTKLFLYRLVPRSRRTRAVLIGDEIFTKVGGYVLGNVITSFIAGAGTFLWMLAFGIPYPTLLGLLVFLLDLIPIIGSTVGGAIVTLVSLTVSLPVAIATLIFYIAYRLAEDYLLVPRIIGHTVHVPALGGMVAIVIGGVVMGIIGALIAIPAAAAIQLILEEITFQRLDNS
jgi:AI-2E family transporter